MKIRYLTFQNEYKYNVVLFIDYAMHSKENLIFSILISNEMQIWKIGEVVMPTAGVLEQGG